MSTVNSLGGRWAMQGFQPLWQQAGLDFSIPSLLSKNNWQNSVPCQHVQQKSLPSERTELFVSGLGMVSFLPTSGKFISKLITQTYQSPFRNTSIPITPRNVPQAQPHCTEGWIYCSNFMFRLLSWQRYLSAKILFSVFYFNCMFVERILICPSCYFGKLSHFSNLFAVVWLLKNGLTQQSYWKYLLYLLFCILFSQNSAVMIIWSQKAK